jgi:hypothetical protein
VPADLLISDLLAALTAYRDTACAASGIGCPAAPAVYL